MRTQIRLLLCALAVAPAPLAAGERSAPPKPTTGHILILNNEQTLEGDIERIGDQYRIKRTVGETWVPADKVLWLSNDLSSAYAFMHGRANLDDADERLRLAKWCHLQGLREQALEEVNAAAALQPRNRETQRLLRRLQETAASSPSPSTAAPEAEPAAVPPVDLSAEAMNQFCTRIQPILMNACASCHAAGQGGAFKLIRTHEHGSLVPKTTQQNLTSVLAEVNLEQPRTSPLLIKAMSVHGTMGQAPLSGRQMPAFHTLEEWVTLTVTHRPSLHELPVQSASKASKPEKAPAPPKAEEGVKEPADPFDPVIFNKESHPDH